MKKNITIFVTGLAIGAIFLSYMGASRVQANFFDDILKGVSSLFQPSATSTSESATSIVSSEKTVPLYQPVLDYEKAVIAAVKKAEPAVVSITVTKNVPVIENCASNPFGDLPPEFQDFFGGMQFFTPCQKGVRSQDVGGGSGFIISADGMVITNKHVVSDEKASYTVFMNDGKKYDAKVLARDPVQDLAILKIEGMDFATVTIGDSDSVELGQTAIAIGNALGEFRNTVSVGVISGLARTVTASGGGTVETITGVFQTDTAINPGNSGGPLLSLKGEVIGINTAVASGAQNVGFAIPVNRAKRAITSVKNTGEIQTPFLGVRYASITPDIVKEQKLAVEYGALVRGSESGPAVTPGSPAEKAGILAEDIILEIDGRKVDKDHSLGDMIATHEVGDVVALKIQRGGKVITLNATLAKRPIE
ncbi:MAG: trypsin-like peptidase domain-containing protein [Patescibacteria group bacterium]|nr:trypsin-like peptidase domain-containing protein [Patescibacteria group bacterium]